MLTVGLSCTKQMSWCRKTLISWYSKHVYTHVCMGVSLHVNLKWETTKLHRNITHNYQLVPWQPSCLFSLVWVIWYVLFLFAPDRLSIFNGSMWRWVYYTLGCLVWRTNYLRIKTRLICIGYLHIRNTSLIPYRLQQLRLKLYCNTSPGVNTANRKEMLHLKNIWSPYIFRN